MENTFEGLANLPALPDPVLSHRFIVSFLRGGYVPFALDFAFQRVSGINAEVQLETINEGGQNLHSHRLPSRINYGNLVLERGYVLGSLLRAEFELTLSNFHFMPSRVLIFLNDANGVPVGAWSFEQAFPVKLSLSDMEAQDSKVMVESMELAYKRYAALPI